MISGSARTLMLIAGVEVKNFVRLADRFWLIFSVTDNFYFTFLLDYLSYIEFDYLEWKIAEND